MFELTFFLVRLIFNEISHFCLKLTFFLVILTDDSGQIRGAEVGMGRLQPPQKMSKSCGCSCHPKKLPRGRGIIPDTDLESLRSTRLRS